MNIRTGFRDAFRQYKHRLGLAIPNPSDDIRVGDLCAFNVDGSVIMLGSALDGQEEEKCVVRDVNLQVDPFVSNGMRCRSLSDAELQR